MSALTYNEARNTILKQLFDVWELTGWILQFDNVAGSVPSNNDPWARATVQHVLGFQRTLGGIGCRRFQKNGVVAVQIFTKTGTGLSESDALSKLVTDTFEGTDTPEGVWFRNVTLNEVGNDGQWFQVNVTADFEYDDIK